MNSLFTESLNNKLLKYSLAAGAVLLGVKEADASVWSTTVNHTVLYGAGKYAISFNGNHEFDIAIATYRRSGATKYYAAKIYNQTGSGKWIKYGTRNVIKPLSSAYSIKAGRAFGNTNKSFIRTYYTAFARGSGFNNATKYIGVTFKISSNTYYGWIGIHMNSIVGNPIKTKGIEVTGYGYEQSAGTAIPAGTLPVELTTFTAALTSPATVELKWNTATEVNNYGFEIQRSAVSGQLSAKAAPDSRKLKAESWKKIGFVKGSGNSNSPKNYSFVDDNPVMGTVEYRLKQIDNNGNFKYSQIVTVNSLPTKFELWQNFPNPFNPTTTIQYAIPKAEHVTLKVYDELGKEVRTLVNENKEAGQYRVSFNGSDLASGIYYYRISAGGSARLPDGQASSPTGFSEVKKLMLLK